MGARVTEFAVADAKARFSELLTRAEAGEEITIKRHGSAVAKIVPVPRADSLEERLRRDDGLTVIVISHDFTGLEDLCPRILHLQDGVLATAPTTAGGVS